MADTGMCSSERCRREILWAQTLRGPVPVDPDPVVHPTPGMVAVHGPTGRAFAIGADDFNGEGRITAAWAQRPDVTIHVRHHATCPGVAEFQVNPNQERLL